MIFIDKILEILTSLDTLVTYFLIIKILNIKLVILVFNNQSRTNANNTSKSDGNSTEENPFWSEQIEID